VMKNREWNRSLPLRHAKRGVAFVILKSLNSALLKGSSKGRGLGGKGKPPKGATWEITRT